MELIFRICLFISGAINFIPSALAFIPKKITDSYGIDIPDSNYELLLRHRAILLGLIGGYMIYSSISKKNYTSAVILGLISMISFLVLYYLIGNINLELYKVMKFDILAIVILLIGFALFKLK